MTAKKPLPPLARTSLRHVGGPSAQTGDPELGALLAHAFAVDPEDEEAGRAHVHGFHSYPARLHPTTAARLVEALGGGPGKTILDPFCGSGTVVVEARLAGARAVGTDINPLALRLARLKARGVPREQQRELVEAARQVQAHAEKRRKEKARVTQRYGEADVALFEPHVLLELDSIRDGIDALRSRGLREDLELVLSAILTKVSRRRGDSARYVLERRLAPGAVARLLVAKAEELARRLEEFRALVPRDTPEVDVHSDDARVMGTIGGGRVDLVITSPPYAATYDYLDHHDARLRWLRLRAERFGELELGARRAYARLPASRARARWDDELGRALSSMARVLRPEGTAVVVLGDSAVEGVALRADEIATALAPRCGLVVLSTVSQPRPHFHGPSMRAFASAPRREHLMALRRAPSGRP